MTTYRGRFAPSPTGPLHFGSLVAAVGSYLEARANEGAWLVRVEDLDPPRATAGAVQSQLDTLAAFDMFSDEPVLYQSRRFDAYAESLERLRNAGVVFDCGCSRRDLPADGVYPGTCREGLPHGHRPRSVRARVSPGVITVRDAVQGEFRQDLAAEVGDFIVRRADGLIAYQLAVVVDDAWQRVSHVVRGADLMDSTPRQIHLQRLLGLPRPEYAHLPLVLDSQGEKLSKHLRSAPVDNERPSAALGAALAFLGQPPPPELVRGPLRALWRFAERQWSLDRVPRERGLAAPAG